jgi:hypothetical protein
MLREFPAAGEPLARPEPALQDALRHHLLDAALQGAFGAVEQEAFGGDHRSSPAGDTPSLDLWRGPCKAG